MENLLEDLEWFAVFGLCPLWNINLSNIWEFYVHLRCQILSVMCLSSGNEHSVAAAWLAIKFVVYETDDVFSLT